jgi:ABC-type multidrug transport system fused ATPase/permease subunit
MNKLRKKINFLQNGYSILTNMLYTKNFVTEGVLGIQLQKSYSMVLLSGDIDGFANFISRELAENRQEFTEIYDTFTSNELCKEYKEFMEKTMVNIYTLTVGVEENLEILFNSAMTRISSSMNDLVSNPLLMTMSNRDTFELMHNLLNVYYINWEKAIYILFNDSIKGTKLNLPLMLIMIGYFIISFIILIIFLKLLSRFSLDREKPINLFLTLKKAVFENLKNAAENFSNKILNKFFGNEEMEEESQQDYQSNIQPSDINIAKFKAANEINSSITKGFLFMRILMVIIIFLPFNLIYFISKYFDFRNRMGKINNFIAVYDKSFSSQIDFIL